MASSFLLLLLKNLREFERLLTHYEPTFITKAQLKAQNSEDMNCSVSSESKLHTFCSDLTETTTEECSSSVDPR